MFTQALLIVSKMITQALLIIVDYAKRIKPPFFVDFFKKKEYFEKRKIRGGASALL